MADFAYDVFISYSSRDAEWVRGDLLRAIEGHGLRVFIDYRDFMPGAASIEEMQRAVLASRRTLLVLTPDYVESAWTNFERLMTQTLDPDARARRLIPLLKIRCTLPLSLSFLTYIDFTGAPDWPRLMRALS